MAEADEEEDAPEEPRGSWLVMAEADEEEDVQKDERKRKQYSSGSSDCSSPQLCGSKRYRQYE